MADDDVRIARWDMRATAGTTVAVDGAVVAVGRLTPSSRVAAPVVEATALTIGDA